MTGIYQILNKVNGKRYIGQASNYSDRKRENTYDLRRGKHYNKYLQAAWNKYGEEAFEFSILEECSKEQLDEREIYYIQLYDVTNHEKGYNFCRGGEGFKGHHTEATKRKLSEANKGRKKPEGFGAKVSAAQKGKRSEETKQKIAQAASDWWKTAAPEQIARRREHLSETSKRRTVSPEVRNKISQTLSRPRPEAAKWMTGRVVSEEVRKKIGDANRGRRLGPLSDEVKAKISVAFTGRKIEVDRSPEATARRSEAQKKVMANQSARDNLREKQRQVMASQEARDNLRRKALIQNHPNITEEEIQEYLQKAHEKEKMKRPGIKPPRKSRAPMSDEACQKISEANKGKVLTVKQLEALSKNWGRVRIAEENKRISDALKGHKVSEETRRKISESHKRRRELV